MAYVKVEIPDGEYCGKCEFLNYYTHELVNLFGDETGRVEHGYECKHHKVKLEVEDHGCYHNVKKCFACSGSEQDKFLWLLLAIMMFGADKLKDQNIKSESEEVK